MSFLGMLHLFGALFFVHSIVLMIVDLLDAVVALICLEVMGVVVDGLFSGWLCTNFMSRSEKLIVNFDFYGENVKNFSFR